MNKKNSAKGCRDNQVVTSNETTREDAGTGNDSVYTYKYKKFNPDANVWVTKEYSLRREDNPGLFDYMVEADHQEQLSRRYDEEHMDYGFQNQLIKNSRSNGGEFNCDPIDCIPGKVGDPFDILYGDIEEVNPVLDIIEEIINEKLTEKQRNMIYDHLGARKYLEEIRQEEIRTTGKVITQQAISKRWNTIIKIVCNALGIPAPRKRISKNKD